MRPIDADELLQRIEERERSLKFYVDRTVREALWDVMDDINDSDILDYAPVRRGEFERQPEEYIVGLHVNPMLCKTCDTTYFTLNKDGKRTICCPYCGAKMKEDGNDENA